MNNVIKSGLKLSLASLFAVAVLSGCSSDEGAQAPQQSQGSSGVTAPAPSQPKVADVKPAEPTAMPKMGEVEQAVADKVEEVKQQAESETAKAVASAKTGSMVYNACVGCHGAAGEGGVGPKLAGQAKEAVMDKLHKYKAGEQVGPMTAMMQPIAFGLSDDDITLVAEYIASSFK